MFHSPMFKSFSYLYNEEHFIAALSNDVVVVKSLPEHLNEARTDTMFPTFSPQRSAAPSFYVEEVLPQLKTSKVVELLISDGACLQVGLYLPSSLASLFFHILQSICLECLLLINSLDVFHVKRACFSFTISIDYWGRGIEGYNNISSDSLQKYLSA